MFYYLEERGFGMARYSLEGSLKGFGHSAEGGFGL